VDEKTEEAIARLIQEIAEAKGEIKTVKEHVDQVLEQNEGYTNLADELKELTIKRGQAKKLLQADQDYQQVSSELEELKFKLKDLQEILSHHLVTYYNETQRTQIKTPEGDVRSLIISAKIGPPEVIGEDAHS
jgi:chromosome segregation ATPase